MTRSEIYKDLDHLTAKWKSEIRELHAIANKDNIEHIGNSIRAMYEMYDFMKGVVAQLEMDNERLSSLLRHEQRIEWEHRYLKKALDINIKVDNLGKEVKRVIRANTQH